MQRAKQLTLCLSNKPGTLAAACRALADAKVNILALSVSENTEASLVRMVVDDTRVGARALEEAGYGVIQTPVRLVELPNKVGALAEMTARLKERKVNISLIYGSAAAGRNKAVLVIEAASLK